MAHGIFAILILASLLTACDAHRSPESNQAAVANTPVVQAWLADMNSLPATTASNTSAAPVDSLIGGLEQRLQANPGDLKGWRLLAQSYAFVGDMQAARSAMKHAAELGADEQALEASVMRAHAGELR
jgi:cytochrome c-type biogenesis protein CcmH/NrfG